MKTREIPKLYCKGFIMLYILKRAIELTHSLSSFLIEGSTITDSQCISEHFNNIFTSIGQDLQKNVAPTKKPFSDYLKAPNTDTFFFFHNT